MNSIPPPLPAARKPYESWRPVRWIVNIFLFVMLLGVIAAVGLHCYKAIAG